MKLYTESEVKKLIDAFEKKYDLGCYELPYYPQSIEVNLTGQVFAELKETERNNCCNDLTAGDVGCIK